MQYIYACEDFPEQIEKSIFLAGPTPRDNTVGSWRAEALKLLEELNYDGAVFIPECRGGIFKNDYIEQVDWELEGLKRADTILFWIPRNLETLPGFTTNVEFGYWLQSGKCVLGCPHTAVNVRYLEALARKNQTPVIHDLKDILTYVVNLLGAGAKRVGGECAVPLHLWNTTSFQSWLNAHKTNGNQLVDANVRFTHYVGNKVFFAWIADVSVYIAEEDRVKSNEFVFARSDLFSCLLYYRSPNVMDTKVVLAKEFRSASVSADSYTWELVGGSSLIKNDPVHIITSEIEEETGLQIDNSRLKFLETRQVAGTFAAHKNHLYLYELSKEELTQIESSVGQVFGVEEDSERVFVSVKTLEEIFRENLLDWSNLGMIFRGAFLGELADR